MPSNHAGDRRSRRHGGVVGGGDGAFISLTARSPCRRVDASGRSQGVARCSLSRAPDEAMLRDRDEVRGTRGRHGRG